MKVNSYINSSDNKEKIYCPICNSRGYIRLGKHLSGVHNLSRQEFESKYPGCRVTTREYSEERRQQISEQRRNPEFVEACRRGSVKVMTKLHQDKEWEKKLVHSASESRRKRWKSDPEFAKYMNDKLNEGKTKWLSDPDNYRYIQECARREMLEEWNSNELFKKNHFKRYPSIYEHSDGSQVTMRSSWEVCLAKFFDEYNVKSWSYETLRIRYELNEVSRYYIPDFYIEDLNLVVEVKPSRFVDNEVVLMKRDAVLREGYNFIFITENELSDTDVLKRIFNVG